MLVASYATAMQSQGSYQRRPAGVMPNGRSTKGQYGSGCQRQRHQIRDEPAIQSGQAHHVQCHHVLQMKCTHVPRMCYMIVACPCAVLAVSFNDIFMHYRG